MLSALDFARRLESGELTAAQAIEICAGAIAKREAEVGAFVTLDLDGARKAAQSDALKRQAAARHAVALKDIFDTHDMPTEYGSKLYSGHAEGRCLAGRADPPLRRDRSGQDGHDRFAHLDPGKTKNPRNLAYTPGARRRFRSSSRRGLRALATGSQTGGSVIRPASFCGSRATSRRIACCPPSA